MADKEIANKFDKNIILEDPPDDENDQLNGEQNSYVEQEPEPRAIATPGDQNECLPVIPDPSKVPDKQIPSIQTESLDLLQLEREFGGARLRAQESLALLQLEREFGGVRLKAQERLSAIQVSIPSDNLPNLTSESEADIFPIIHKRKVKYDQLHMDFTCPNISIEKALKYVEEFVRRENLYFHNALVILQTSEPKEVKREVILERIQTRTVEEPKYVVLKSKDTPVLLSGILARNEANNDSLNHDAPQYAYIFCCNYTRSLIQPLLNPKWFIIVPWNDVSEDIHCSAFHQALIPSMETRTLQDIVVMISRDEIVIVFDGDNVGNRFKDYISNNPTRQIFVFCNQITYDNQIRRIIDDHHDNNVVLFKSHTLENAADCDIIKFVCYIVNYCQHKNREVYITIYSKDKIFKKMLKEKRYSQYSQLLLPENSNSDKIRVLTE